MGNFLLLLILFVLASVLLLIVYLIDRVNLIEKQTVDRAATELKNNNASGPFRGMEGGTFGMRCLTIGCLLLRIR